MSIAARVFLVFGGICEVMFYLLIAIISGFVAWLFISTSNSAGYIIGGFIVAGIVGIVIHVSTVTIPSLIYDVRDKS